MSRGRNRFQPTNVGRRHAPQLRNAIPGNAPPARTSRELWRDGESAPIGTLRPPDNLNRNPETDLRINPVPGRHVSNYFIQAEAAQERAIRDLADLRHRAPQSQMFQDEFSSFESDIGTGVMWVRRGGEGALERLGEVRNLRIDAPRGWPPSPGDVVREYREVNGARHVTVEYPDGSRDEYRNIENELIRLITDGFARDLDRHVMEGFRSRSGTRTGRVSSEIPLDFLERLRLSGEDVARSMRSFGFHVRDLEGALEKFQKALEPHPDAGKPVEFKRGIARSLAGEAVVDVRQKDGRVKRTIEVAAMPTHRPRFKR